MAITQTISTVPPAASVADPPTFDARQSALMDALSLLPGEVNTWGGQANASAAEAAAGAAAAQIAATTAREATDAVLSQGVAPAAWSGSITYGLYDAAIGSDDRAYRSLQAGNLNHDPATDTGAWWLELNPDLRLAALLMMVSALFPDWDMQSQGPAGTYPPADPWQPACLVWSRGVERYRVSYTWGTGGGVVGVPLTEVLEYSSDSGGTYVALSPTATLGYATGGHVIGISWE